jgi:hypothetical protein
VESLRWSLAIARAASSSLGRNSLSIIAPLSGGMCLWDHSSVVVFVKSGGGIGGGSKSEELEDEEEELPLEEFDIMVFEYSKGRVAIGGI